MLLGNVAAEIS